MARRSSSIVAMIAMVMVTLTFGVPSASFRATMQTFFEDSEEPVVEPSHGESVPAEDTSTEPAVEPSHGEAVPAEAGATNMSFQEEVEDSVPPVQVEDSVPPVQVSSLSAPSWFDLQLSLTNFSGAPRGVSLHRFGQVSVGQIFQRSDAPELCYCGTAATQRPVNFFFDGVVVSSGGTQVAEGGAAIAEGEAAAVAEPPAPEAVPVVPPGVEFGQEPWIALLLDDEIPDPTASSSCDGAAVQATPAASCPIPTGIPNAAASPCQGQAGSISSGSVCSPRCQVGDSTEAVVSSGGTQALTPEEVSNEPEHFDSEPAEVHLEPSLAATEAAEDASNVSG